MGLILTTETHRPIGMGETSHGVKVSIEFSKFSVL
jgi:hypothetical protein